MTDTEMCEIAQKHAKPFELEPVTNQEHPGTVLDGAYHLPQSMWDEASVVAAMREAEQATAKRCAEIVRDYNDQTELGDAMDILENTIRAEFKL